MRKVPRYAIFVTVLVTVVSLYIRVAREHVPAGSSQPLRLKLILTVYNTIGGIGRLLTILGIGGSWTDHSRSITRLFVALFNAKDIGVTHEDTVFDGVMVRVYRPETATQKAMVFYHGGGWCTGSIDTHDNLAAFFAREGNMVVVSVEYRLNPEYSIADGREDCVRATKYLIQNAASFGVDPHRVVVAGDSAGGTYAATVPLVLRDEGFSPMPKLQLLIYPGVQMIESQLPSSQQHEFGPILTQEGMSDIKSTIFFKSLKYKPWFSSHNYVTREVREHMSKDRTNVDILPKEQLYPPYKPPAYAEGDEQIWNQIKESAMDPHTFPLMADNHKGLPEAYIFTAQCDLLRDDGYLYAHRLRQNGVKVTHYNCPHGWHGMVSFWDKLRDSRDVLDRIVEFLKNNL